MKTSTGRTIVIAVVSGVIVWAITSKLSRSTPNRKPGFMA